MRVHHAGGPLAHEHEPAHLRNEGNEPAMRGRWAPGKGGQLMDASLATGNAASCNRTRVTLGLSGRANQGAQFHQRLVELRNPIRNAPNFPESRTFFSAYVTI